HRRAGAGAATGPRIARAQPGVRPRRPVVGLGGPERSSDRPLGSRHGPTATAAERAAGRRDLPGLLAGRTLAGLGWLPRWSRPALGPGRPARGPAHREPLARESPAGVLAGRAATGHGRRGWHRAAVGPRDGRGTASGWRPGRPTP